MYCKLSFVTLKNTHTCIVVVCELFFRKIDLCMKRMLRLTLLFFTRGLTDDVIRTIRRKRGPHKRVKHLNP